MQFRRSMTSKRFLKQLLAQSVAPAVLTAALCAAPAAYAQQTTSSITGQVTLSDGAPAAGTKVVVVHTPSGTTASATADSTGRFSFPSLRVGGPYVVRFEPQGAQPQAVNDIYLQLGEPFAVNLTLQPVAAAGADLGQEIVVSAQREDTKLGAQRVFNRDTIENAPTVSRDLKDIIRQDPRVLIDPTNSNSIQIAGTSPRYNSITIDGVKTNDDFGLNNNGYPTHHSPIPLDAVDQLAVVIAPFDVDYDGFQGGNVNIVTKSGTNNFHGTGYYFYSNDKLSGNRSGSANDTIPQFQTTTRGGSLGGPIVEDKLFFFASYEDYKTVAPATYGTSGGGGGATAIPGVTAADVAAVASIAQRKYGYNAGSIVSSSPEHDRSAIGKLDWNINDDHRASFTYERSETNQILDGDSTSSGTLFTSAASSITAPPRLALSSSFYTYGQVMNNYVVQEFSDWTPQFSTEFAWSRKTVDSTRVPLNGYSIGEVRVVTPDGGIVNFGPDYSSQSNVLTTSTDTWKGKAKYELGEHTISGGYERETDDYYDLFIQRSLGQWYFSSLTNFANGTASRFQYANAYTGNPSDNAAIWNYSENSFYLQDRWEISDDLTLQAGLRYELYTSPDQPRLSTSFESRYGFGNNANLDGRELLLPRMGFNWKIDPATTLHGGFGQFSTLGPAVWMSNSYNNDGFTQRSVTLTSGALLQTSSLAAPSNILGLLTPNSGFVNALDPHFSIPSSVRYDIALDHSFENGVTVNGDFTYTNVQNAITYRDLRMAQIGSAPDGRPVYAYNSSGQDLLLTDTHHGDSTVLTLDAQKGFDTEWGNFQLNGGYAYTQARDVNPGTSSVASSNFNYVAVSDPNHPGLATSNYEAAHNFTSSVTWTEKFFGDAKTSVTLLGTLRSGLPYSYTFACGSANPFGDSACNGGQGRELLYVPSGPSDPLVNWTASKVSWAQWQAYIDQYGLKNYEGKIAPRNAFNAPWFNTLDMHFLQEIPTPFEGHKLQLTLDTVNFSNLLFPSWGRLEQVAFPGYVPVTTPTISGGKYTFTTPLSTPSQSISARASVWQIQMGLHYSF
jgi:outer membrane receptor for ferrienterochelin and colicin